MKSLKYQTLEELFKVGNVISYNGEKVTVGRHGQSVLFTYANNRVAAGPLEKSDGTFSDQSVSSWNYLLYQNS